VQYRYVLTNQRASQFVRRKIPEVGWTLRQKFPNSFGLGVLIANNRAEDAQRELYIPFRRFSGVDVHIAGAFFPEGNLDPNLEQ